MEGDGGDRPAPSPKRARKIFLNASENKYSNRELIFTVW